MIMTYLSKKANHDGTVRFMNDFVAESGALKSVRVFVISIENKHVFWGTARSYEL